MPGEEIYVANPPPDPSHLPDEILKFKVQLNTRNVIPEKELHAIQEFRRAADYIAAAMIFLKDNILVERDITADDIKARLLGHWGTCPGLSLVYAHANLLIRKTKQEMLYVVGPGHGAPAILACLWLESSLSTFWPKHTRDRQGLHNLITTFSVPGGFPSHINAQTPGSIHEGGELGYALSVSFGAVMDKPDLVVICVIGDGEAETGPTATAWHGYKYIDPAESGAVIPIVHANGFKISERTIYGTMDDKEVTALFIGYGYQVRFVEDLENIDQDLAASMAWALDEIHKIQKAARDGNPIIKPRWPVLILRTPKGWGGPKKVHGEFIEGSFHAHQVPLTEAKTDPEERKALQKWLTSYDPCELFGTTGEPNQEILSIIPEENHLKLGQKKEAYAAYTPLDVPAWEHMGVEKGTQASCMKVVGEYLHDVIKQNPSTFRIFSPDELVSNKLDAVLRESGRNFQWDVASRAKGGRVIEILSEHTCQGMLQGYTLTGRTGLFPSYEAFLGIVHTMMVQYSKFVKLAHETSWRQPIGSLNYLETSTWARQEHNGFSHQNPSFIGAVLNLKPTLARVYLPPDANCFLSTVAHCLRAKDYINLMVGSKQPTPVWLSPEEATKHCIAVHPSGSLRLSKTGCALLRKLLPSLRLRVVNVTDLMILAPEGSHPHSLEEADWDALFTSDKPVHFNYHGYPQELRGLIFGRPTIGSRVSIEGYREEGTTTSALDMMLQNHTSRYHVAQAAVRSASFMNQRVQVRSHEVISELKHRAEKDKAYIYENGADPDGTFDVPIFE
ncbi:hypothetical protein EW026_g3949 [Hermanssonia centrifuga]|uniref:Phosphoketolase n=1 Tax=Hermanssonia centrifuga TaxID=98765 RepID=A0A4S4KJW7_9APHY|nr:hypothetical protein EW026_g3949 [Hermanssonia centrifuga]